MRVLIAIDSFKGNLSSLEVAAIVEKGIRRVYKDAKVEKVAVADGGEGTVEAIVEEMKGEYIKISVNDPLLEPTVARYGIIKGNTAIIEMAEASGLCLISKEKQNPMLTSTYGTGELILDSLNRGCRKIILGLGGSATNDAGLGMAMALGVKFVDHDGRSIGNGGVDLDKLVHVDVSGIDPRIMETEFVVACDVDNLLYGEKGASRVFGPQKGATPEMVDILDRNLLKFAAVIKKDLGLDNANIPGAGAAGGLGYGLTTFCNATMRKGVDIVFEAINIEERIQKADIVITGEGRIDGQTIHGKTPVGVAARGKKYGKPVFAIAGFIDKGAELVYEYGIDSIMSSMVGPLSLEEAIAQSPRLIEEASERLFRIIKAVSPLQCY
jgi:glycerate kinase